MVKRVCGDNSVAAQGKGGKGRKVGVREGDYVSSIVACSSHDDVVFVTSSGKAYACKAWRVPEASVDQIGKGVTGFLSLPQGDRVTSAFSVSEYSEGVVALLVTRRGQVKRVRLPELSGASRSSGLIVARLAEGDELVRCSLVAEDAEANVLLGLSNGKVVHFGLEEVPVLGRDTLGVMGAARGREVVGTAIVDDLSAQVVLVSSRGLGKRVEVSEFPVKGRGTSGTIGIELGEGDSLAGLCLLSGEGDEVIAVSGKKAIRVRASELRLLKRPTRGSRVISLEKGESVLSICAAPSSRAD
jgi:DNA gyrase subunit A